MKLPRFSLLSVFLVITVIACLIGAICDRDRAARRDTRASIEQTLDRINADIERIERSDSNPEVKQTMLDHLREEANEFKQQLSNSNRAADAQK